jgi:NhaA family Na+:H+ antiporter
VLGLLTPPDAWSITRGVVVGLVVGKPVGVLLAVYIGTALGVVKFPRRVTWAGMVVVATVAGIGFTMSIFIGGLAFTNEAHLSAAKLGVLVASVIAGCIALLVGRFVLPIPSTADIGPSDAEASTLE